MKKGPIVILCIVLLAITAVVGFMGYSGTKKVYNQASVVIDKVRPGLDALYFADRDAFQALAATRSELVQGSVDYKKEEKVRFEDNYNQVQVANQTFKDLGTVTTKPEAEEEAKKAYKEKSEAWAQTAIKIHDLAQKGTPEAIAQASAMVEGNGKQWAEMRDQIDTLEELYEHHLQTTTNDFKASYNSAVKMEMIAIAAGIVLGIVVGFVLGRSILKAA